MSFDKLRLHYKVMLQLFSIQINDGKLVWQKLGARDRVAYYATLGLVLAGSVLCMRQIYQMIFPEKHSVTDKVED